MTNDEKLDKVLCFMDNLQQRKTTLKVENTELKRKLELEKDNVKKLEGQIERQTANQRSLEGNITRLRQFLKDTGIPDTRKANNGIKSNETLAKTVETQGKVIDEKNKKIKELEAEIERFKNGKPVEFICNNSMPFKDVHTRHCCGEHKRCKYGKEENGCTVCDNPTLAEFSCNCEWM